MKCTNCQMVDQLPGTKCSHCGKLIPDPKPMTLEKPEEENAAGKSDGVSEGPPETEESEGQEAPAETEEVVPESGHVDNVGDETETEAPVSQR